ncbi:MAG: SMC-Scp complex subunit ScpB [Oscillospiraceae bacterium]|jgi:segregation and condensation protein B|nr:SMC-Scp complex subunit ScpB [Oscillospiraceae bacterium]
MEAEKTTMLQSAERKVEAILFASGDPVEGEKIAQILDIDEKTVKNLIERIRDRYLEQRSPFDIAFLSGAYQMYTLPEYEDVIRAALTLKRSAPLSQAALEVLAVIAYNQPVTRAFVEQVRGVDCSSIVRSLAEKGLIEESGRLNIPGKPIAYRTTANFLRSFGLEGLEQLPTLPQELPDGEDEAEEQLEGQMDFFED